MSGLPTAPTKQPSQPPQGTSSHGSPPSLPPGTSPRKERGAIAAQACDTCRSRKQRCDEQRPKCGTCQKFRLECNYREPQPTKKDKTLVEILDRIKTLEGKIDSFSQRSHIMPSTAAYSLQPSSLPSPVPTAEGTAGPSVRAASPFNFSETSTATARGGNHYQYVSSVHEMLGWPAIQQLFASVQPKVSRIDLSSFEREGAPSVLARHSTPPELPNDTGAALGGGPPIGIHNAVSGRPPITGSDLGWETMLSLSKAYFDSFNLLCPILNRQAFMSDTLPAVFSNGFSDDMASTIALLVLALGEVAIADSTGIPVHVYNGRASGIKGGTKDRPPGLELFNEARRRMGLHLTECSLECSQMFELASIYCGTCFRPLDFWRMTTFASIACQMFIRSHPGLLSSAQADLTRRVFWHISIMETGLNLELGLPLTGLEKMESIVGLPDFSSPFSEEDYISNQESHFQEHSASQIVLRRLLVNFHSVLSQGATASSSLGAMSTPFSPTTTTIAGVNQLTIHQLAVQLEQWRGMLPVHLRWDESSPGAFPNTNADPFNAALFTPATTPISPAISATAQQSAAVPPTGVTAPLMFTTDLDAPPSRYPYVLDIQVALLRSRYYYTKFLIHRPFVYKALHHPDAMTHDDAVGVAECLKACLKWPVAMSPTCKNKRLIPCSFFFTRNFFGILVLLHMSTTVPILRRIRSTLCGERFELDASETVGLYVDWLRDLKEVDAGTVWQWEIIRAVYGLEE